jgi:IS605 OrfB family transposase
MITISLQFQNQIDILDIQKEQNSLIRFAYNRFCEGKSNQKIKQLVKQTFNLKYCDSWFITSAIEQGKSWFNKRSDGKIVFGGRKNLKLRSENKLSKEEWKLKRLHPIYVIGEANQTGNRKFQLDLQNDQIIFKFKKDQHFYIQLPKISKSTKNKLQKLEQASKNKEIPFTVKLTSNKISISFDKKILKEKTIQTKPNRILGIDMNPNSIGFSVLEFNKKDEFKVIDSGIIDNKELNKELCLASDHPKQIKQHNKRNYEVFQVARWLIKKTQSYQCSKFVIEDLENLKGDRGKGKKYNRLINNNWNRINFIQNLQKHCNLQNIELVKVNPSYSSIVGNILYSNYPDPINASIEIARRGYKKLTKGWFWPTLISKENLSNHWKEVKDWSYSNWKELASQIKNSKVKYRVPLESFSNQTRGFRISSQRSKVRLVEIY